MLKSILTNKQKQGVDLFPLNLIAHDDVQSTVMPDGEELLVSAS